MALSTQKPTHSYEPRLFNDTNVWRDYGTITTFSRGVLVLLLRAGFILIQMGCIPITDVHMILLHNIIDITCGTIVYGGIGYIFSFGFDAGGIIGFGGGINSDAADMDNAILGWCAVVTGSAIFTTMFAGRMHWLGNITITLVFGGVIQSMFMHWAWAESGWMHRTTFMEHNVSYKDHGGGCIIHTCGGLVALIGAMFLGRRLMRLRDIDESSLPPESPGSAVVGYIMLMIGLMGICLPTPTYEMTHIPENYIGYILFNNLMAAAGGIMTVVILQIITSRDMFTYWMILRCMQGAIAGIVTVSSGVDVYKPLISLAISIPGAVLFHILSYCIFNSPLEDYANIVPIHFVCGLFGTILPPLAGTREGFGAWHKAVIHLGWQMICDLAFIGSVIVSMVVLFSLLTCLKFLRNPSEEINHRRATLLNSGEHRTFFRRIIGMDSDPQYLRPGYHTKTDSDIIRGQAPSKNLQHLPPHLQTSSFRHSSDEDSRRTSPMKIAAMINTTDANTEHAQFGAKDKSEIDIKDIKQNTSDKNQGIKMLYTKDMKRHIYTMRNKSSRDSEDGIPNEGSVIDKVASLDKNFDHCEAKYEEVKSDSAGIDTYHCTTSRNTMPCRDEQAQAESTLSNSVLPSLQTHQQSHTPQPNVKRKQAHFEERARRISMSENNLSLLPQGLTATEEYLANQNTYLGKLRRGRHHSKRACNPYKTEKTLHELSKEKSSCSHSSSANKVELQEKVYSPTESENTNTAQDTISPPLYFRDSSKCYFDSKT